MKAPSMPIAVSLGRCARAAAAAAVLFLVSLPTGAEAQYQTMQYSRSQVSRVVHNSGGWIVDWSYLPNNEAQLFTVIRSVFPGYHMIRSKLDGRCLERAGNAFFTTTCGNYGGQLFKFTLHPWAGSAPPEMRVYPYMIQAGMGSNPDCLHIQNQSLVASQLCSVIAENWQHVFLFGDARSPLPL
jgi:hypothetical protein